MKYNTYLILTGAIYAIAVVLSIIFMIFNLKSPVFLVCGIAFFFQFFGIVYVND